MTDQNPKYVWDSKVDSQIQDLSLFTSLSLFYYKKGRFSLLDITILIINSYAGKQQINFVLCQDRV